MSLIFIELLSSLASIANFPVSPPLVIFQKSSGYQLSVIIPVKSITTSPPNMSRRDQVLVIEPPNELTFTGRNIEKLFLVDSN